MKTYGESYMKKLLIFALCLVPMLCACGKDEQQTAEPPQTLRVQIYDRGDVPDGAGTVIDNAMTRYIRSEFGEKNNIDVRFVPVARNNGAELEVLIATGDAPDIMFNYSYQGTYDFYRSGYTTDLTDYISSDSPLRTFLGEELMELGNIDGRQVMIPAKRLVKGRQAQLVRADWLDKIGMSAPTNTDEFYAMLKAFKALDPGGNGDKNIPYGLSGNSANYSDLMNSFRQNGFDDRDMNCSNMTDDPGYREGVRFMNKLYNEGLVSPYYKYDNDRKKVESDIADGYVGFFCDDLGRPLQAGGVYEQLMSKVPGARLAAVDTWTDANGNHPKCVYGESALYISVASTCSNPKNAVKYLEWMCDPDVMRSLQYGFEGVTYNLDADGIPRVINSDESRITHWYTLGFDLALIVNGKYTPDDDKILAFNANATVDPELYMKCYDNSMRDSWNLKEFLGSDRQYTDSAYITKLVGMLTTDCITCPPDEFDAEYDRVVNQLNNLSLKQITVDLYKNYDKTYGD